MKQTAVEWFFDNILSYKNPTNINGTDYILIPINKVEYLKEKAKEMEKAQMGYTKEDVLRAGEMGEINHHDTKHIVSYLDEAKHYNEAFNANEK
jgi:aspartate aminotransferase-like enzyme